MSKENFSLFVGKYGADKYFIDEISLLLDKLVDFGYISRLKYSTYVEKIYSNINEITFGNKKNNYDYKSGYYDANKKELYIKDTRNITAVFLRLLYVLTTTEIDNNEYMTGYSVSKLRKDSYRMDFENYGINRAVISNLVCKLCDSLPPTFNVLQDEKKYTHNFLGIEIESTNDLYSLEGKLLSETCFVLDLDPELLYSGLFTKNPVKYLNSIFDRKKFLKKDEFLKLFDLISKKYNTYNKLSYLSDKLNNNYLEYKKHVLNNDVDEILKEQKVIEEHIKSIILKLYDKDDDDEFENNISLSEVIENLEYELKEDVIAFQDILSENIIKLNIHNTTISYASKLKRFNEMLIVSNERIIKELKNTILYKLMPETEVTGINLVQKVKYAIIGKILSDKDFTVMSNTYSFYNITNFENNDKGTTLVLLISKDAPKIIEVSGLNKKLDSLLDASLNYIPLDNLKYAINSNYSNIIIGNVEKLFTELRNNFEEFKNISLDNVYTFDYNDKKYIVSQINNSYSVVSYTYTSQGYGFVKMNLSENYKVFGKTITTNNGTNKNLPTIYKK